MRSSSGPTSAPAWDGKQLLDLDVEWRDFLGAEVSAPATFTKWQAVNATMKFMARDITVEDAHAWADFISANPAIEPEDYRAYELREFLEDWSSASSIPVDVDTVSVWQSRFAHD